MRADKKIQLRNQMTLSEIKTKIKTLKSFISLKNKEKAAEELKKLASKIGKAKNKGIIHKKTASRWVSRISKRVQSI